MYDLGPAAAELARVVQAVPDDRLHAPTPCPDYTLGDLLEHVHGLAAAFALAGRKQQPEDGSKPPPQGDAARLPAGWREEIAERLDDLTNAWRAESSWAGSTWIAGFEAPAAMIGMTAANELVVHGWDVARSIGADLRVDDATLEPCRQFVAMMSGPGSQQARGDAFGPAVPVGSDAPALDQVVAGNGRDPSWSPPTR
jgi:uncharacterized protein (TIGR03086 family)